jgi:hypothetical protein
MSEQYGISAGVCMFPHAQFDGVMSIDEMKALAISIKEYYQKVAYECGDDNKEELLRNAKNIIIYGDNSFCNETNGIWNVVMSWKGLCTTAHGTKSYRYTYIIMIDKTQNKTFAGPLQHVEYIYDDYAPIARFHDETCGEQFYILDNFMKEHPKAKVSSIFPIVSEEQYKKVSDNIERFKLKIVENNARIADYDKQIIHRQNKLSSSEDPMYKHRVKITIGNLEKSKEYREENSKLLTKYIESAVQVMEDYNS